MRTLIIGGGLSGLALANLLEQHGQDYLLVEARDRFGGRIKTATHDRAQFDLGPAWFWPGQPRILEQVERFGLEKFEQHTQGMLAFENAQGQVQHGHAPAAMAGSWRMRGGLSALINALAAPLPDTRTRLKYHLKALSQHGDTITAMIKDQPNIEADLVVLALPPRIAAEISYAPALTPTTQDAMRKVPTWMAGQAKAVAVYDRAFWREEGLSGDAISHAGPMVEIHDASANQDGPYALFGFIGMPPQDRMDQTRLRQLILEQFGRLFGPKAQSPAALFIEDWAQAPQTTTQADHAPLHAHPIYGLPPAMHEVWQGKLIFSGTEVAREFGGFIEGALEAAENAFDQVMSD